MGIEPTYLAWKASVLPLNYTRKGNSKSISNVLSRAQCPKSESNQRHEDFQSSALPTELSGQTCDVLCVIRISLKQLLLSLTTRISLQDFPAFVNINFIYFLEIIFTKPHITVLRRAPFQTDPSASAYRMRSPESDHSLRILRIRSALTLHALGYGADIQLFHHVDNIFQDRMFPVHIHAYTEKYSIQLQHIDRKIF